MTKNFLVEAGEFLKTSDDVANLVVGIHNGSPVYLKQVSQVIDGPEEPANYVSFGYGQITNKRKHFLEITPL